MPKTAAASRWTLTNKVIGVELTYLPAPTAPYELVKAELIDEETARGQTVAGIHVLDAAGLPAQVQCFLAWPWEGWQHPNHFDNRLLPGNTNYPYQHIITNTYDPDRPGPLAIFIGDQHGNVLSDVIGGLGLPADGTWGFKWSSGNAWLRRRRWNLRPRSSRLSRRP